MRSITQRGRGHLSIKQLHLLWQLLLRNQRQPCLLVLLLVLLLLAVDRARAEHAHATPVALRNMKNRHESALAGRHK